MVSFQFGFACFDVSSLITSVFLACLGDAEGKSSHDCLREMRHRRTWTRARVFLFLIDATGDASSRH